MKLPFVFFALLAVIISYSSAAFGQMNYSDRRLRADTDSRTLKARKAFNSSMRQRFETLGKKHRLESMELYLHPRLVSQYGRGKASAMKVIPQEMNQVMRFISEAKFQPRLLAARLAKMGPLNKFQHEEIATAVEYLGETQTLRMEYWGYMIQQELPPEYDLEDLTLTYKAHWHEADSYYELYPEKQMRINVIKAVITEMNRPWYVFW